ncbi:gamma-glutamyltransferase family protein [Citricoccus muralis]|uniref:Gamma-glutamyltransferase 1 n=1 Tax=Citricoccus muralis TaxID=169134 RepID=A0A3D9L8T9_9MICC|nr:gamma-glutamyltransferase [Citricoccus muralis]REE02260.1 gamma-glutamyltransferase 1 [Citricoccus muralis]
MKSIAFRTASAVAAALLMTSCSAPSPVPSPAGEAGGTGSGASDSRTPDAPSSGATSPTTEPEPGQQLQQHAVAAAHPEAVEAGMDILAQGGNAADAAVATAFAVAVVEPYASGIGGGGSVILAGPGREPVSYDYREVVAQDGRIPDSGTGVPGFVAGLAELHAEHGDLDWDQVLEPAIGLAGDGFPVSEFLAQRLRSDFGPASIEGLNHYHDASGEPLAAGDRLVQRDLAQTMTTLAQEGPEVFYTGSLAQELTSVDGLDAASLAAYESEQVVPVGGNFGDYEVLSAAPPLPGAALVQQLQLAEALGIDGHEPGSPGYVDRLSEAWIAAEGSVKHLIGDPDFVDVPVDRLTDPEANARIAEQVNLLAGGADVGAFTGPDAREGAVPGAGGALVQAAGQPVTAGNTTHLTVVDQDGFTVSMTNTLTSFWGGSESEYVGGFFLNNQLSRFATEESEANQPEPGRKSVSWSAPSMVLDDQGRPVLGLGSPGGHQIPNILTGVLVAWGLQGATLQEAVDAPRFHLQDGVLAVEEEPSPELAELITARDWELQRTERDQAIFGSVQALEIDYETGQITGARDSRREADVAIADADSPSGAE